MNTNMASNGLDLWLGKQIPRYTSYPPAPFFHDGVTSLDYATALRALPPTDPISVYVHVPFCKQLCLYCGCHTSITRRPERISRYLTALQAELATLARHLPGQLAVSHLHFGGGTPTILNPEEILALFQSLRATFDFSKVQEIAIEIDPRTVTKEKVQALAASGVTRASLGVQDFNPAVQKLVNRHQPFSQVQKVCDWLRSSGIVHINFDLMYGLPMQTPDSVADTARQSLTLAPERISLFSYAHVPQVKPHQKPLEAHGLPDKYHLLEMDSAARAVFKDTGYREIGMDHFARPDDALCHVMDAGNLRRNFQGYTDDLAVTMLGIGASSISRLPNGYYQNERELRTYQDLVATDQIPVVRGLVLTQDDLVRSAIIERLMCNFAADIDAVVAPFGKTVADFKDCMEALKPYQDAGLIAIDGAKIQLTSPYRMAIRVIAAAFDNRTPTKTPTYSRVG
jgi:oxygen-independent coproporphyrinogen III oxidase